jgi:Rrf2 family protein
VLALTKKTDYALIALWHLSRLSDGVVSARELAAKSGIGLPILTNILKELAHHGVVTSSRGVNGGYSLTRSIESISLRHVIEVIEGPVQLVRCAGSNGEGCELESRCPIRLPAHRVHLRLREFLDTVSVEELFCMEQPPVELHAATTPSRGRAVAVKE